jgi:expansin (peptidoglycan-binding protein)
MAERRRLKVALTIAATVVTTIGSAYALDWGEHWTKVDHPADADPATSTPDAGCTVRYTVTSQDSGRFTADVAVNSSAPRGWKLTWENAAGQRVRLIAGTEWQQNDLTVTVSDPSGNTLQPDRALHLLLNGTYSADNPTPTNFSLNGRRCQTVAFAPTPTTDVPTSTRRPPATPVETRRSTSPTATTSANTTATPVTSKPSRALGTGRIQYGKTYTGKGTYYGATGAGNCLFEASSNLMVAAMNQADYESSQACGAYIQATGPKGTITVKIVDQCPECKPGDIDFSAQAFAAIADPITGQVRISWQLLSPTLSGPMAYRYKEGSSQWWCGIQVRNHRNPVLSVEAMVNGTWKRLSRQAYNYFLSADGSGCGKALRTTDIYGHQVTESALPIATGIVQAGSGQFGPPR